MTLKTIKSRLRTAWKALIGNLDSTAVAAMHVDLGVNMDGFQKDMEAFHKIVDAAIAKAEELKAAVEKSAPALLVSVRGALTPERAQALRDSVAIAYTGKVLVADSSVKIHQQVDGQFVEIPKASE